MCAVLSTGNSPFSMHLNGSYQAVLYSSASVCLDCELKIKGWRFLLLCSIRVGQIRAWRTGKAQQTLHFKIMVLNRRHFCLVGDFFFFFLAKVTFVFKTASCYMTLASLELAVYLSGLWVSYLSLQTIMGVIRIASVKGVHHHTHLSWRCFFDCHNFEDMCYWRL